MKKKDIFGHYIKVGETLSKMFGKDLEVSIHDWSNPKSSIIAIFNGEVTGRSVGDPTSNIGLKRIKGEIEPDTINVENKTPRGERLKSSTLSIRNERGKIIGTFSLNWKVEKFENLLGLIQGYVVSEKKDYMEETESFFYLKPEEEVKVIIQSKLNNTEDQVLKKQDRIMLIETLYEKEFFQKKRSIDIVAKELGLSRPTVYKYIAQCENSKA